MRFKIDEREENRAEVTVAVGWNVGFEHNRHLRSSSKFLHGVKAMKFEKSQRNFDLFLMIKYLERKK
jgi:hypothetical protein